MSGIQGSGLIMIRTGRAPNQASRTSSVRLKPQSVASARVTTGILRSGRLPVVHPPHASTSSVNSAVLGDEGQ